MESSKKLINRYLLALFLCCITAVTLRTVACFTEWNATTMHFDNEVIITIANVIAVVGAILFASYPVLTKSRGNVIVSFDTPYSYVPSGMLAIALFFTSCSKLSGTEESVLKILSVLIFALGIMSAIFFFLTVFLEKNENEMKAIFGMGLVLYCALSAAYLYFDKRFLPTNSPAKIADMIAYLFAAIFFLYETRIALGRSMWRIYTASGLIAALICAYSSIPALIYYVVSGTCISGSPYECVLLFVMAIFITSRVIATKSLCSAGACEAARCIETLAAKRDIELSGEEILTRVHEGNNMEEIATEDIENYTMDLPLPDVKITADEEND